MSRTFPGFALALLSYLAVTNVNAAVVNPSELVLDGDYAISAGDPLRVTALFDGTFSSISSVQIIFYLSDYYSKGESYQFTFYDDSDVLVDTLTHDNDNPSPYYHIGLLTNSSTIENLFYDGSATFQLAMLAGSVNVSSIAVNINGTFTPTATTPIPAAAWLFGSGLLGLSAVKRSRKESAKSKAS